MNEINYRSGKRSAFRVACWTSPYVAQAEGRIPIITSGKPFAPLAGLPRTVYVAQAEGRIPKELLLPFGEAFRSACLYSPTSATRRSVLYREVSKNPGLEQKGVFIFGFSGRK